MSTRHSIAAAHFLENERQSAWHDETLWLVRQKRDKVSHSLPEWERLRDLASEIKLYSNSHLDTLLEEFERNATANGATVHWAKDADEHNRIVYDILAQHGAKNLIKSKSMLTEECRMNAFLMARGIDVIESDLGERILQLMHLEPSHIVMPAIHIKREEIAKMMVREMGTEPGNSDPTYLTHAARKNLREKFLHADAALTGANFAVASTGDIVVCTNEGNDLLSQAPHRHFRHGEDRTQPRVARRLHPPPRPLWYGTALHDLHLALPPSNERARLPYHHRGQWAERHPCYA